MELNIQGWKEFQLSNIFEVKYGINMELNVCDETTSDDPEGVAFVARTSENNGVSAYVKRVDDKEPQPEGTITVAGGGSVLSTFVQKRPFYSGRDLYLLIPKIEISLYMKMFITTVLYANQYRYSYGRQANKTLPYLLLKLPIQHDENGNPIIDVDKKFSDDGYIPDWQFMEAYIKSLYSEPITTKRVGGVLPNLEIDKWEEFRVGKIFTMLNGKGITKEEIEINSGDLPAIQSGEENNGVLGKISESYCKEMNYTMTLKPCLTVARTGSAGFVSYQGEGCVVGDSAKILLLDENVANVYIYMFLQTMLSANRFKYDYGRKVTESKYLEDILKLPIQRDENGNPIIDADKKYSDDGYVPDWRFMEDYIKSLPYSDRI